MARYLISYDVSAPRVRARLVARLEKAGRRLQLSVFMVKCGKSSYEKLVRDLLEIMEKDDSLLCLPVCENCYANARITGEEKPLLYFG